MDRICRVRVAKHNLMYAIGQRAQTCNAVPVCVGFEHDVTLTGCLAGLSVRFSHAATDIPAAGTWPSPIMTHGATLRRLASKLAGPEIEIAFGDGRLLLNTTSLSAREA